MNGCFEYGEKETAYLKSKDKTLGRYIEEIGHIYREIDSDLFSSVVHHIIGQQISSKSQATVWRRMRENLGEINSEKVAAATVEQLQSFGMTFKKAAYICDFAEKVRNKQFDLEGLRTKTDAEAISALVQLKGIGVWTAEMILIFCLQRPNVLSYGDLAVLRGLRMIYRIDSVDRIFFEECRRRFSPYCSTASLYLWAVAGGALNGLKDGSESQSGAGQTTKSETISLL